jgi:hypothetical protein
MDYDEGLPSSHKTFDRDKHKKVKGAKLWI